MNQLIVYISGRYSWETGDDYDEDRMGAEVQDETDWAGVVVQEGHYAIRPLHLTVDLDGTEGVDVSPSEWRVRDVLLMRALPAPQCAILMRPGWGEVTCEDPRPQRWYPGGYVKASIGAAMEHEAAVEMGWRVLTGELGEDEVRAALRAYSNGNE